MWRGRSSPSWTISSARSVSQAAMPSSASASLSPISWVAIDLTLTTSSTPCDFATSATIRFASVGVAGPVHDGTLRGQRSSSCDQVVLEVGQGLVLDRGAGRAQVLPVLDLGDHARPLVADRAGGVREVVPQLRVRQRGARGRRGTPASRRRWRPSVHRPPGAPRWRPGSRPGASCAPRSAAATAARRCASGTSCRPPPAPPRRSRARAGPCRTPSRPRCRRSSSRRCRRSRSTPRRRAGRPAAARGPARAAVRGRSPTPSIRSEWQVGW